MPAWSASAQVFGLSEGRPSYSAGSKDTSRGPGKMYVTGIAAAGGTVTLNVAQVEGNIPAVGDIATITGTILAGANKTAALTGVSINAATGVGTISYAAVVVPVTLGQSNSGGQVSVAVPEVAEALVPNQAYQAFAMPRRMRDIGMRPSITLNVQFPSAPVTPAWAVQGAIANVDAEYVTLFSGATAGTFSDSGAPAGVASTVQFWPGSYNFVRFKDTGSAGGASPTVIAKLLI